MRELSESTPRRPQRLALTLLLMLAACIAVTAQAIEEEPVIVEGPSILDGWISDAHEAAETMAGWLTSAAESVAAVVGSRPSTQRVHPPACVFEDHPSSPLLWYLVVPQSQSSAPWIVAGASAIGFLSLFLILYALHAYATDELARDLIMQKAEDAMHARDQATEASRLNGFDDGEAKYDDGSSASRRLPIVQVIPAAHVAAPSARRSLLDTYVFAYAANAQRSLTGRIDHISRLVSSVHAVISCVLGVLCLVTSTSRTDPAVMTTVRFEPSSACLPAHSGASLLNPFSPWFTASLSSFNEDLLRDIALMVTCGYLLYDLLLCSFVRLHFHGVRDPYWKPTTQASGSRKRQSASSPPPVRIDDSLTLLHHVLIIVAFSWGVHLHIGTAVMSGFLLNEASTPALNLNYFLASARASGLWCTPECHGRNRWMGHLYKLNGIALYAIFFLLRIVWNLYVLAGMTLTWLQQTPLWFDASTPPFILQGPASMPADLFCQALLLSMLAVGHVVINLFWFQALTKAVRRKLGAGAAENMHEQ